MASTQDALVTLPHERYKEYLEVVYKLMAQYVPAHASVIEVGVRPENGDRGVISRRVIPHRTFTGVDRTSRGEVVLDVLKEAIEADVILSTCVLHHTPEALIPKLLINLHAPVLLFSGPNVAALPELFGDHQWHIDIVKLRDWLGALGYRVSSGRIGLTEPLSELFVVAVHWPA